MAKIPINSYHGSTAYLATIPIDDGNILYNSTTKEILVDENGTRIRYGGAIVVDTALSTTSTNPVQNKVITIELNTINTNLSNIAGDVSDLQLGLQSAEDSITNAFEANAPIEKSPSTHNYAVGDYLIWNDALRRVTSAIAVGDEITNSNTVLTNTGAEVSQINADLSELFNNVIGRDTVLTLNTPFTTPSDGYLRVAVQNNNTSKCYVFIGDTSLGLNVDLLGRPDGYQSSVTFIKKGVTITMTENTNARASFYPYSN